MGILLNPHSIRLTDMKFQEEMDFLRDCVNTRLGELFTGSCRQNALLEAMRYSLLAGGKRIRPILVLKFCEAAGGYMDDALPLACAIEMVHTYSLIHDDLPIMDNDDLRRGKPTCHKVYGECVAALAGDALQSAAYYTLLSADIPAEIRASAGAVLAKAAGEMGMCGGQYIDTVDSSDRTEELLTEINDLKTGALISAACEMGVVVAGGKAGQNQRRAAAEYGKYLARAFQIRDDMLDIISTDEAFGKHVGSDAENGKPTYASLLGIERCQRLVEMNTQRAKASLAQYFEKTEFFDALADLLAERAY